MEPPVVVLLADSDGVLTRLVGALGSVVRAGLPRHALIGGLAVIANLAQAHRITADVDTVADNDADGIARTVDLLVSEDAATRKPTGDGIVFPDGTKVDIIPTGAWNAADLPDDPIARMFVMAHWWAVDTASVTRLVVVDRSEVVVEASSAIARPAALVAAKLQSMRTRRGATAAKATSDVYDIYRLLRAQGTEPSIGAELATAPVDVGHWCAEALTETLIDDAVRWAGRINGAFAAAAVEPDDLAVTASLTVEAIRS